MISLKIDKITITATPDGQIKAEIQRNRGHPEIILFSTLLELLEWPEIETETPIIFSNRGLVPKLNVPFELIFLFCSPEEIKTFVALAESGDQLGWLAKFKELVVALDEEHFPLNELILGRYDLAPLISNPKGYHLGDIYRCYRADCFW